MLEVVAVAVVAGSGMLAAGSQAVSLGLEIRRDKTAATGAALRAVYDTTAAEPVPDDMMQFLNALGGGENGTQN